MGYAVYKVGKRWGGYGVPAYCEHPGCKVKIDRGMSYACAGEPFSEMGCDRYFCEKHRVLLVWDVSTGEKCTHDGIECDCEWYWVCERCKDQQESFPYKREHPEWVKHILKDESWEEWRKNNPEEVENLKAHATHTA